jgi:hypothetical protein
MVKVRDSTPPMLLEYWHTEAVALNWRGAFDVLDWIELLATANTPTLYGSRLAWFLWDLARATTQHQLTTGTYPGQGKRPPTPHPPCSCKYHPSGQHSAAGTLVFTIDVMCIHHGSNLVRQAHRLGIKIEHWQAELYEASIRNGIPIQFASPRGRRR